MFDGEARIFAQKEAVTAWQENNTNVTQLTGVDTQNSGSTVFNGSAYVFVNGALATPSQTNNPAMWANAVQMFGGTVDFNGAETVLSANNDVYTAQTIVLNTWDNNSNSPRLNFNGKNVEIYATSPYGTNGIGYDSDAYVTFANQGDALIRTVVTDDGLANSNAVGYLGSGDSTLVVEDTVNNFTVDVLGSGRFAGNTGAYNGTSGLQLKYCDTANISSSSFVVNVTSGQDYRDVSVKQLNQSNQDLSLKKVSAEFDKDVADSLGDKYGVTYGILAASSYENKGLTVSKDTDTVIRVSDGYWNSIGLGVGFIAYHWDDRGVVDILGNVSVDAHGTAHALSQDNETNNGTFTYKRINATAAVHSIGIDYDGCENESTDGDSHSITTLGSAGKTVNLNAQVASTSGHADVYGIYGDYSNIKIDGLASNISALSNTETGKIVGANIVNQSELVLNSNSTNITVINPAGRAIGLMADTGSTISVNGNATINAVNGYALFATTSGEAQGSSITLSGAVNQINGRVYATGQNSLICLKGDTTITYNGEGAAVLVNPNAIFEVHGNLTLGGYIENEGHVVFTDDSTLSLVLTDDMIKAGEYQLIEGNGDWDKAKLGENTLYDIAWDGDTGKVSITQKSAESLVESLPVTSQQAGTIAAVLPTATAPATPELGQIANAIRSAASGEEIAQIAEDLAPSTAPVVSSITQNVNNALVGVANARLAANRAAGDVFTGGSAWAQMIYNSADQDATKKTAKLESDTYGITVGIDGKIGDNLTIGAGFGVTKTDAESGTRDIDVDSYALFGYTEYNADNGWFVNGMVNAIRGRYEENKAPAGVKLTAKYQTTVLGAGVATGYHFENGISPEVGLRYLRTHQGSYNDGAQKIHTDGTNLLTAAIGAKYEKAFEQGDWKFTPSARVAATYDVVSDDTESAIRVIGGGQYHVISEHQKRAAYEAGIGLEASNGDWDFSVSYNGEFRSHFQSHTGMLKAKYNF